MGSSGSPTIPSILFVQLLLLSHPCSADGLGVTEFPAEVAVGIYHRAFVNILMSRCSPTSVAGVRPTCVAGLSVGWALLWLFILLLTR